MTRDEALALGRKKGAPLGGRAVKNRTPPDICFRCGQSMAGRKWHSRFAWGTWDCTATVGSADKYFDGDITAASRGSATTAWRRKTRLLGMEHGLYMCQSANLDGCTTIKPYLSTGAVSFMCSDGPSRFVGNGQQPSRA